MTNQEWIEQKQLSALLHSGLCPYLSRHKKQSCLPRNDHMCADHKKRWLQQPFAIESITENNEILYGLLRHCPSICTHRAYLYQEYKATPLDIHSFGAWEAVYHNVAHAEEELRSYISTHQVNHYAMYDTICDEICNLLPCPVPEYIRLDIRTAIMKHVSVHVSLSEVLRKYLPIVLVVQADTGGKGGFLWNERKELKDSPAMQWLMREQTQTLLFLQSVQEEFSRATKTSSLIFCVSMRLQDVLYCLEHTKTGKNHQPCIWIPKQSQCGLFDGMYGSSSFLGIHLEKDVLLPISMVYSMEIGSIYNHCFNYTVPEITGQCNYEICKVIRNGKNK